MQQLVNHTAAARDLKLDSGQRKAIAQSSASYPPSVTAAFELIASHGVEVVIRDSKRLGTMRTGAMIRYLQTIRPTRPQRVALSILLIASPLPLGVIEGVVESESFIDEFVTLIDTSLVTVDSHGHYALSAPIADLVGQHYRLPDASDLMPRVAELLSGYFRDQDAESWRDDGVLGLVRSYSRAHLLSGGRSDATGLMVVAGDIIAAADELYQEENYQRALDLAEEGVELSPDTDKAHRIRVKSLIKMSQYARAQEAIADYWDSCHNRRQRFWLQGFLARHQDQYETAITEYQKALDLGMGGRSNSARNGYGPEKRWKLRGSSAPLG